MVFFIIKIRWGVSRGHFLNDVATVKHCLRRATNNFSFLKGDMSDQVSILVEQNRTVARRFLFFFFFNYYFKWKGFWNNFFLSLLTYCLVKKKFVRTQCPTKVKISSDIVRWPTVICSSAYEQKGPILQVTDEEPVKYTNIVWIIRKLEALHGQHSFWPFEVTSFRYFFVTATDNQKNCQFDSFNGLSAV